MTKNITNFIVTIILATVLSFVLPWWSIMTAALATSLFIPLKKAAVFFVPFLAIFVYWASFSLFISSVNNFTLAGKISQLLELGGNPYILIFVTGIVGGLAAGIAAIFGRQIVALSHKQN